MVHFKIDSENVFCLKMSHLAKSYKKKVVFTNFRNFKIFFRQIKISCCLQNISKFHIGQINHAWLRAFWKKKFQKFQKLGKKNFPHKIPQGPPQAGPLCLGVFPSCHNTFHQIWSNSSFLPFPPLLYRLSEFTLNHNKKLKSVSAGYSLGSCPRTKSLAWNCPFKLAFCPSTCKIEPSRRARTGGTSGISWYWRIRSSRVSPLWVEFGS